MCRRHPFGKNISIEPGNKPWNGELSNKNLLTMQYIEYVHDIHFFRQEWNCEY